MILLPNFLIRLEKELNNAEKENQAHQKEVRHLRLDRKETSRDFWLSDRKINCIKTVALLKYNISVINIKPISPFNWLKLQELIGLLLPLTISITDLAATRFYSHKIWQNYSHKKMKKLSFLD